MDKRIIYTAINSKGEKMEYIEVDTSDIKKVLGFSGGLIVATNVFYGSNTVIILKFKTADFRADSILRAVLFGQKNTYGKMILTEKAIEYIMFKYSEWAGRGGYEIARTTIDTLRNYHNNLGRAVELFLVDKCNYKLASYKQDTKQKIDVIDSSGARWQIKSSIGTPESHNKPSINNGKI